MNSKHGRQEHWTNLEKYHRAKIKERRIRKAGKESRKEESRIRVSRKFIQLWPDPRWMIVNFRSH